MTLDIRRISIWSILILAMGGLLFGLAKLGSSPSAPIGTGTALAEPVTAADWSRGSATAPHTLVEYSDFQCPACRTFQPLLKRLGDEQADKVRFVYRHFPLNTHQNAEVAAQAAEAAGKQNKFWEMHDVLFNTQEKWAVSNKPTEMFAEYARSLGLNVDQFKKDSASPEVAKKVRDNYSSGQRSGVGGTPTFFLDGKQIAAPTSYEQFVSLVNNP